MLKKLYTFLFIRNKKNSVYYIHGNDVLPKPLNSEEELNALISYENGDLKARDLLIEHNLRLVVFIAKRYETNPIFMEDLISIGTIGLIKGIDSYSKSPEKCKLITDTARSFLVVSEYLKIVFSLSCQRYRSPLGQAFTGGSCSVTEFCG